MIRVFKWHNHNLLNNGRAVFLLICIVYTTKLNTHYNLWYNYAQYWVINTCFYGIEITVQMTGRFIVNCIKIIIIQTTNQLDN